jgi:hypothetical protein
LAKRKPSGIPSAAIIQSQYFSQFQLSFSTNPRWVPVPPVKSRGSMSAVEVYGGTGMKAREWRHAELLLTVARIGRQEIQNVPISSSYARRLSAASWC